MNLKELYLEIYRSRPESILRFMLVSLFVWTRSFNVFAGFEYLHFSD